nr:hypothetical protein [Mesorhizobium delmotii]
MVIVRDMWLTGFDAPCMHTMYVDNPKGMCRQWMLFKGEGWSALLGTTPPPQPATMKRDGHFCFRPRAQSATTLSLPHRLKTQQLEAEMPKGKPHDLIVCPECMGEGSIKHVVVEDEEWLAEPCEMCDTGGSVWVDDEGNILPPYSRVISGEV